MFFGDNNDNNDNNNNNPDGFSSSNNSVIGGLGEGGLGSSSSKDNLFSFSNEDSNDDLYPKAERSHDYYSYEDENEDRGINNDRSKEIEDLKQENERLKSELLEAKSVRQEYFRLFQENKYLIDKMHELELSYLNKLSTANQKIKTLQSQLEGATAASQQMQSNWIQVAEHLPSASDSPTDHYHHHHHHHHLFIIFIFIHPILSNT